MKAKCVGTIINYCPTLNQHLVVFDNSRIMPSWIVCSADTIDILIGPGEFGNQHAQRMIDKLRNDSKLQQFAEISTCFLCGFCQSSSGAVESASESGVQVDPFLKACKRCKKSYHSYCMPTEQFRMSPFFDERIYDPEICLHCIACRGCCGNSLWNTPMIPWSTRRLDSSVDDQLKPICGGCLRLYKESKQFCSICYALYSDTSAVSSQTLVKAPKERLKEFKKKTENIESIPFVSKYEIQYPLSLPEYMEFGPIVLPPGLVYSGETLWDDEASSEGVSNQPIQTEPEIDTEITVAPSVDLVPSVAPPSLSPFDSSPWEQSVAVSNSNEQMVFFLFLTILATFDRTRFH